MGDGPRRSLVGLLRHVSRYQWSLTWSQEALCERIIKREKRKSRF